MKRKKQKWLSLLLACACLTGAAAVPITASETDPLQAVSVEAPEETLENSGEVQETAEKLQLLLEAMEDEEFLMSIPLALEGDEDNE